MPNKKYIKKQKADLAQFARNIAVLLKSGLNMEHAINIVLSYEKSILADFGKISSAEDMIFAYETQQKGLLTPKELKDIKKGWMQIASSWLVAQELGCPLANALFQVSNFLETDRYITQEINIAAASAKSSAAILRWLPALGILLTTFLGLGSLKVLLFSFFGIICLCIGVGLCILGAKWQKKILKNCFISDNSDGFYLLLISLSLKSGSSIAHSKTVIKDILTKTALFDNRQSEIEMLEKYEKIGEQTGSPLAVLLEEGSHNILNNKKYLSKIASSKAENKLLLPLGACSLPAFIILTILPVVYDIFQTSFAGL